MKISHQGTGMQAPASLHLKHCPGGPLTDFNPVLSTCLEKKFVQTISSLWHTKGDLQPDSKGKFIAMPCKENSSMCRNNEHWKSGWLSTGKAWHFKPMKSQWKCLYLSQGWLGTTPVHPGVIPDVTSMASQEWLDSSIPAAQPQHLHCLGEGKLSGLLAGSPATSSNNIRFFCWQLKVSWPLLSHPFPGKGAISSALRPEGLGQRGPAFCQTDAFPKWQGTFPSAVLPSLDGKEHP